ncbi:hypothetical protein Trydic_g13926 [Trypoxylus dichotomus]
MEDKVGEKETRRMTKRQRYLLTCHQTYRDLERRSVIRRDEILYKKLVRKRYEQKIFKTSSEGESRRRRVKREADSGRPVARKENVAVKKAKDVEALAS